ncbi:MAG: hypothetical protein B6U94_07300 [Thermofilum sp. ex4484_79]|nr:MAG: hypothetical protein B6U94_07300 [Thermofilum sp. ex4484_79]HDD64477.1 hypothetical protein [Thermoprotei archaeon]
MSAKKFLSGALGLFLIGLGAIFIIASTVPGKSYRLMIGVALSALSLPLLYFAFKPTPKIVKYEVKVSWDPSGKLAVEELRCPKCGATLPPPKPGDEYVKCQYCGAVIKLVEEPIW